jgi:hypothetical protein
MELSKKQLAFYTMFLLVLSGGISMTFAPPPGDGGSIWDRFWKVDDTDPINVEGEVSIDDTPPIAVQGTVDIGNQVTVAPGTEVRIPGKAVELFEGNLGAGDEGTFWIDVSGYKKIYVYFNHSGECQLLYTWYLNGMDGYVWPWTMVNAWVVDGNELLEISEVKGTHLKFEIKNTASASNFFNLWIYASPV